MNSCESLLNPSSHKYGDDVITQQLFIRWLQATALMPSMQFSWVPWQFDDGGVATTITKKFTQLHEEYADYIIERFNLAVSGGDPGGKAFLML